MSNRSEAVRGCSVRLRRSLRTRVVAACAIFFAGLGLVQCVVLPRSFEAVARESLRERTQSLATNAAFHLRRTGATTVADLGRWFAGEPDFESVAILDSRGRALSRFPAGARGWDKPVSRETRLVENVDHFVATAPVGEPGEGTSVAVRTSTERLHTELTSIVGLFLTLLLLATASLFVLAGYLVRAVLAPLEEIHQAAQHLASGELYVGVPRSGDPEIDELGELISQLGDERRREVSVSQDAFELIPHCGVEPAGPPGHDRRRSERRAPNSATE